MAGLTLLRKSGQVDYAACASSISSNFAGLMLPIVDRRMDRLGKHKHLVHYVRYMDDIVLLARTRWELQRAIAALHEEIAALGLRLHRVKRFIGRTTHGFAFLGHRTRAGSRLRPSAEGLGFPRTAAYVNVLAGFISERVTGTAFASTCCVGGVGTSAISFAGKEAYNAPCTRTQESGSIAPTPRPRKAG